MKVVTARESFLADYEVLEHMQSIKEAQNWTFDAGEGKKRNRGTDAGLELEAITRDVLAYFTATNAFTDKNAVTELAHFLNQYELVKVEKLQILNSLPRSMVHLYALVEECGLRFDETVCDSIIQKINLLFPLPEVEEEEEEEEEEQEEQEEDGNDADAEHEDGAADVEMDES